MGQGFSSTYGNGLKNFVQNHPGDPELVVVYTAIEGPEAATFTRGTARLRDGEARIALDETFAMGGTRDPLPPRVHYFLFGPRGTGKSTWLRLVHPDALAVDLLAPDVESRAARPERREGPSLSS